MYADFNPLHREGGDNLASFSESSLIQISIHSTARVETNWETGDVMILGISIHSTARVETG